MTNPFFDIADDGQFKRQADAPKVTKSSLFFGPLRILQTNTVPEMEFGRIGDMVIIDNELVNAFTPTIQSAGMWVKIPNYYREAPTGNMVIGRPGARYINGDIIEINGTTVNMIGNTLNDLEDVINNLSIANVTAYVMGNALAIQEATGGALTFTSSNPIQNLTLLGLYTKTSIEPGTGTWIPYVGDSINTDVPFSSTGGGGGANQFRPADMNTYDEFHLYFGDESAGWRIRRVDRDLFTDEFASVVNNPGVLTLNDAWPQRTTLAYTG